MDEPSVETLPATVPTGKPWDNLTADQRECVELEITDQLGSLALAERFHCCDRTIRNWRATDAYQAYFSYLVGTLVARKQVSIRAKLAHASDEMIDTLINLALGKGRKGKPAHPYQKDYLIAGLDRVAGKPQAATVEVGAEIPTEHGPIRIIFKAGE